MSNQAPFSAAVSIYKSSMKKLDKYIFNQNCKLEFLLFNL